MRRGERQSYRRERYPKRPTPSYARSTSGQGRHPIRRQPLRPQHHSYRSFSSPPLSSSSSSARAWDARHHYVRHSETLASPHHPVFVRPPTDREVARRVAHTAKYTVTKGAAFEATVKAKERTNPRFSFLFGPGTDPHAHAYYRWCLHCYRNGSNPDIEPASSNAGQSTSAHSTHGGNMRPYSTPPPLRHSPRHPVTMSGRPSHHHLPPPPQPLPVIAGTASHFHGKDPDMMHMGIIVDLCVSSQNAGAPSYTPIDLNAPPRMLPPPESGRVDVRVSEFYRKLGAIGARDSASS